jgi:hypothetical protein
MPVISEQKLGYGGNGSVVLLQSHGPGRPVKFTPERIEQIRNLHERGRTPEEIADIIGVTVGSLRVTCSRHGISLRRLVPILRHTRMKPELKAIDGNGDTGAEPTSVPEPNQLNIEVSLVVTFGDRRRIVPIPLGSDAIVRLLLHAEFTDVSVGDLVARIIVDSLKK